MLILYVCINDVFIYIFLCALCYFRFIINWGEGEKVSEKRFLRAHLHGLKMHSSLTPSLFDSYCQENQTQTCESIYTTYKSAFRSQTKKNIARSKGCYFKI